MQIAFGVLFAHGVRARAQSRSKSIENMRARMWVPRSTRVIKTELIHKSNPARTNIARCSGPPRVGGGDGDRVLRLLRLLMHARRVRASRLTTPDASANINLRISRARTRSKILY